MVADGREVSRSKPVALALLVWMGSRDGTGVAVKIWRLPNEHERIPASGVSSACLPGYKEVPIARQCMV